MITVVAVLIMAGIVAMDTTGGPQLLVSEPVVSCYIVGVLLGAPHTGLLMGLMFQLLSLRYLPLGAARLHDGNMGAFVATAGLLYAITRYNFVGTYETAMIVPALLFGDFAGYIGKLLTNAVRRLNGRRSVRLTGLVENGAEVSIPAWHFAGLGLSFLRGMVMAVVLIPLGVVFVGLVRFVPDDLFYGLHYATLLVWGPVTAAAVVYFWMKGTHRYLLAGAVCGLVWLAITL